MVRRSTQQNKRSSQKAVAAPVDKVKRMTIALAKIGFIFALVTALLYGLNFAIAQQAAQRAQALATVQKTHRDLQSQSQAIREQIDSLGVSADIYAALADARSNMDFKLDLESLRPLLESLKSKHHITTLSLSIGNPQDLTPEGQQPATLRPTIYSIQFTIGSLSDAFIYSFLNDVATQLSGFILFREIEVTPLQPISIDVLGRISRGLPTETVRANVRVDWAGFLEVALQDQADSTPDTESGAQ
jgi:hypothetical protein